MYNIAVIGAGEIGSRHLQGIVKSELGMNLYVVDLSEENLEKAKKRINEINYDQKRKIINYQNDIRSLPPCIDLMVIATSSNARFNIIKSLVSFTKIKYLLLEKVLFQRIEEYVEVSKILNEYEIMTWVNCPRRLYPYLQELKTYLTSIKPLDISYSGGAWGLACNAIHIIDLVNYFTGEYVERIDVSRLDKMLIESKRPGFFEISGELKIFFENSSLTLSSKVTPNNFPVLDIYSDDFRINLFETKNLSVCQFQSDKDFSFKSKIQMPFQSELTNIVMEQILETGSCILPTYEISKKLHIPFIKSMISFFQKNYEQDLDYCPIT